MSAPLVGAAVLGCLLAAIWFGMRMGRLLPEHHLGAETRDTVKLATGLVATMAALLLGLLVSSAKQSHDTRRNQVIQMAAKIAFLDRVLTVYGPEAAEARTKFRVAIEEAVQRIWHADVQTLQRETPEVPTAEAAFAALESLSPHEEAQRTLKARATELSMEMGELRAVLVAQSVRSISIPMLIVMVCWLAVIFMSFSLLAPPNATARISLFVAALSVSGAVFLILELDEPFGGSIRLSSQPIMNALSQIGK
jgi:hypothetical protein